MNKLHENTRNIRKFERFGELRNKAIIHEGKKLAAIKGDLQ